MLILDTLLEKILFRPVLLPQDHVYAFEHDFKELFLKPEPDVSINAIHFKLKNPKGIILYFHGNKDNLERWGKISSALTHYNYEILVMDYRGYGKSTGLRTEENLYQDALYCYNFVKDNLGHENIVIYGRSLGTGIASWLAAKIKSSRLILETPYTDMRELFLSHLPWKPSKLTLNFKLRSIAYLKKSEFPILIVHGTKDGVVPFTLGKKLYESIGNPNASFIVLQEGKHNDLYKFEDYWKNIEKFVQ